MGFHGGLEVLSTEVLSTEVLDTDFLEGGCKPCNHPILYIPFLVIKPS